MMALQILQISKCYTMWPKLTQGYKVQDVGPAQSGNNLLGLIKAAHSQVSWADFCKMKMIFIKNQKAECRTHHSIHSLPTTAGALGQQLPGCLSQATAKSKGVMYDYVKSDCCTKKLYHDFYDAILQQPSFPMLLQEDARAVVSDAAEVQPASSELSLQVQSKS